MEHLFKFEHLFLGDKASYCLYHVSLHFSTCETPFRTKDVRMFSRVSGSPYQCTTLYILYRSHIFCMLQYILSVEKKVTHTLGMHDQCIPTQQ